MRNLLLCMAGATFALGSSVVRGHGEHAVAPLEQMDCSRPPAAAITQLPEPLANWARLECGAGGQKLVAAPGWQWRYPSSWFDRPFAPAGAPDASIDEPGAKYFVEMTVEVVTGAAAQAVEAKSNKTRTRPVMTSESDFIAAIPVPELDYFHPSFTDRKAQSGHVDSCTFASVL